MSSSFSIPQLPPSSSSQPPPPVPAGPSRLPPSSILPPPSLSLPNLSSPLTHQPLPSSRLPPSTTTATPLSSLPSSRRQSLSNGTGRNPSIPSPNGAGGSGVASGSGAGAGRPVNGQHSGGVDDKSREERILTEGLRSSVHLALSLDQLASLHPDISPFQSPADIVERLLPYHVFQIPNEDLVPPSLLKKVSSKGKGRAREWELEALMAGEEEEETEEEERARLKEVISFAKRKRALEKRFKKVRLAEGKHASPTPQTIFLARASIDNELSQMETARALTTQARQNYQYLEKRLSYQVQGIPWSDEANPPPTSLYPQQQQQQQQQSSSRPNSAYPSYQPGTPQYYQQQAQQQQQQQHYSTQNQNQNNFRQAPSSSSKPPPRVAAPPGVDLNAAVPLSLPGTTIPTLVELGLLSGTGGSAGLTSEFRVEGTNVCFTVVLSKLNATQLQGLAKLLNAVGGGGGGPRATS